MIASSLAFPVYAQPLWNDLCAVVEGQNYSLVALGQWRDWFIRCGPDGYTSALLKPVAHLKRAPEDKWFCLMGAIDRDPESIFRIGSTRHWTATKSGMLSCFANDITFMRWNNRGVVSVEIQTA